MKFGIKYPYSIKMQEYSVQKSFWVQPTSQINWDPETMGREGVGIPFILIEKNQTLRIRIENRGIIAHLDCRKALDHEMKWNTRKTAPVGTPEYRKFVIVPVRMLDIIGYTSEAAKRKERTAQIREEKEKQIKMQQKLF